MAVHSFNIDGIIITVNLPPFAEAILADQVISNNDWLQGFANMVAGKVSTVKRRIADGELRLAMSEGRADQLPATEDAIVQAVFNRPGYKNRKDRNATGQ